MSEIISPEVLAIKRRKHSECQKLYYLKNKEYYKKKNKEYREKNKEYFKNHSEKWRKENIEKLRETRRNYFKKYFNGEERRLKKNSRLRVLRALNSGKLIRPKICEHHIMSDIVCGGAIEAHHDDYNKPLEIKWLCKKHHNKIHKNI